MNTFSMKTMKTLKNISVLLACLAGTCLPASQAAAGTLNGSSTFLANGTVVNLTSEGSLDWATWGLTSVADFDFDHKDVVTQKISTYSLIAAGTLAQIPSNSVAYAWSDGTPTLTATNTFGVSVDGLGNGFQFIVPADTTARLLRVYVSGFSAEILFEATLSDGSATALNDDSYDATGNQQGPVRVYEVRYAADSVGQTLTVKCSVLTDQGAGSVSLQAATLQLAPAQTGTLRGGYSELAVASTVDLTDEGRIDWAHWGTTSPADLDRKIGGTNIISDFSVIGVARAAGEQLAIEYFDDNFTFYSWNDGTPAANGLTPSGLYLGQPGGGGPGLNSGFEISVPAGTYPQALKVYVGAYAARMHFEASLSDGSAPTYVDETFFNEGDGPNRAYILTFAAASPGQKLTVKWWILDGWGNVTLQSAVVRAAAPFVNLVTPVNSTIFYPASGGMQFTASTIDPIVIAANQVGLVLNGVDVSSSLVVSGTPAARSASYANLAPNRFYSGQIRAADNFGNIGSSFFEFDTFSTNGTVVIEAEDYDHDVGQFIDYPLPGAYLDLGGFAEFDFHTANAVSNPFRLLDPLNIQAGDQTRAYFGTTLNGVVQGLNVGDWQNYTRTFPNANYHVYLRYNALITQSVQLDRVANDQSLTPVGELKTPGTGSDAIYRYAGLKDIDGNLITVALSGVQTLRMTGLDVTPGFGGLRENFLMLVPLPATPQLTISSSGGQVTISFRSQAGSIYTLQYKNTINDPTWQSVGPSAFGDGSVKSIILPVGQSSQFFQLSVQ